MEAAAGPYWTHAPDVGAIGHLARLEDEAATLCAVLEEDGPRQKEPIVTPRPTLRSVGDASGVRELRRLDTQLVAIRRSLGLDPESRAWAGIEAAEPAHDALDDLQDRRRARLAKGA